MDEVLTLQQSMMRLTRDDLLWLAQEFGEFGWSSTQSDGFEILLLHPGEEATLRLAKAHCFFEYCVENRSEISWRRVDNLQYLGGRRLLLQCLTGFADEASIFHCDYRLRREIFNKGNLFLGEWTHLSARGDDLAQQDIILAQRDKEDAPDAALSDPAC